MVSHTKPTTEMQCRTCLHFDPGTTEPRLLVTGKCRRYPPVVVFDVGEDAKDNTFPMVRTKDWCGEWMGHDEVEDEIA